MGSAFVVAPNLAITAAHVIDGLHFGAKRKSEDKAGGIVCFGNDLADCKELSIGSVVFKGEVGKDDITLIELPNHNPVLIPPLPIADPLPKANVIVGRYAYVLGFSFIDTRLPVEFLDRLLAKISGKKRLMPGRILGFGVYGSLTREEHPRFTSDISTTAGTSGGPLIDLSSGEVFGVNRAGEWQGERGKFSYAIPIPEKVREIIASRNRGELIKVMDLPKSRLPLE